MNAFLGEIRLFAGNYAPTGWALCDGSALNVTEYQALFLLLGTTYGGDGRATFHLPDLRGRVPLHQGQHPMLAPSRIVLSNRALGATGGAETETLQAAELPFHQHTFNAWSGQVNQASPAGNLWGSTVGITVGTAPLNIYQPINTSGPLEALNAQAMSNTGGGGAHDNLMPSLPLTFIISTEGLYPSGGPR